MSGNYHVDFMLRVPGETRCTHSTSKGNIRFRVRDLPGPLCTNSWDRGFQVFVHVQVCPYGRWCYKSWVCLRVLAAFGSETSRVVSWCRLHEPKVSCKQLAIFDNHRTDRCRATGARQNQNQTCWGLLWGLSLGGGGAPRSGGRYQPCDKAS